MGIKRKNLLKKRMLSKLRAHSHLFLISAILLVQLVYYIYICFRLTPYTKYMFAASETLSIIFIIFLSNSSGKNEFKLAWMFPVLVSPIFGISIYFLAKHNTGWTRIKKKLQKTRKITNDNAQMIFEKNLRSAGFFKDEENCGEKSQSEISENGEFFGNKKRGISEKGDFNETCGENEKTQSENENSIASDSTAENLTSGNSIAKNSVQNENSITSDLITKNSVQDDSIKNDSTANELEEIRDLENYTISTELFPSFAGNRTRYFPSAEEAFPFMLAELEKAENFIFLDYFIIDVSEMWNRIFAILKEKAKNGVEVRILFDSIGSINIASKSFVRFLAENNIEAREFMPMIPVFNTGLNNRDHHKIMDIDGRICFTGGANITDEYINLIQPRFAYWKDSVISVEGSSVISFTKLFLQIWHTQEKKIDEKKVESECQKYLDVKSENFGEKGLVLPYGDDGYNTEELAENIYRYILCRSKKYVRITTPYIVLDNNFLSELIFTARRGVEVEIIFPGNFDHFLTYCVGLRYVKILIENGIKVYFYDKGFIHSKNFVGDGEIGTVGSINLDYRSLYHHFECGILLYKTDSLKDVENDFEKTKAECVEITPEIFRKRVSLFRTALGCACKIFGPLL